VKPSGVSGTFLSVFSYILYEPRCVETASFDTAQGFRYTIARWFLPQNPYYTRQPKGGMA